MQKEMCTNFDKLELSFSQYKKSPTYFALPQPLLQSLGLRPTALGLRTGRHGRANSDNFSIKGKNEKLVKPGTQLLIMLIRHFSKSGKFTLLELAVDEKRIFCDNTKQPSLQLVDDCKSDTTSPFPRNRDFPEYVIQSYSKPTRKNYSPTSFCQTTSVCFMMRNNRVLKRACHF